MFTKKVLNSLGTAIAKTRCYYLRLFYLSIYCMLFIGCGKEIEQANDQQDVQRSNIESQIVKLNAKLYSDGNAEDVQYDFDTDSEVRIPESLQVTKGNAGNNIARIYFNVDESGNFEFYCNYIGGASNASPNSPQDITSGHYYHFDSCYMEENYQQQVYYTPGYESIQFKSKSVVFKLISADPRFDTQVTAEFEIESH